VKLELEVSREHGRLVPCYPTFGAHSACPSRLLWIDRVVCAKALPKSALSLQRKRIASTIYSTAYDLMTVWVSSLTYCSHSMLADKLQQQ
jgi:hypothetical protein